MHEGWRALTVMSVKWGVVIGADCGGVRAPEPDRLPRLSRLHYLYHKPAKTLVLKVCPGRADRGCDRMGTRLSYAGQVLPYSLVGTECLDVGIIISAIKYL